MRPGLPFRSKSTFGFRPRALCSDGTNNLHHGSGAIVAWTVDTSTVPDSGDADLYVHGGAHSPPLAVNPAQKNGWVECPDFRRSVRISRHAVRNAADARVSPRARAR